MKASTGILLSVSILFAGCFTQSSITNEELKATVEHADITVFTKDSLEYKFSKENYWIQGDTLSGSGVEVRVNTAEGDSVRVAISFSEITSVEVEEFDVTGTMIVYALSVGAFVALLAGGAALSGLSGSW
jgi:hypothetical protein